MKDNLKVLFLWLLIIVGVISCLTSCHSAKYHFDKFIDKGGQVECSTAMDDSIRNFNIIMPVPKWQMRLENNRHKDSLNALVKIAKAEEKGTVKIAKAKERTNKKKVKEDGKTDRVDKKQTGQTDRTEIRQAEKTKRSLLKWYQWLLAGYFLNPIIRFLYRKARDGLIRFWMVK